MCRTLLLACITAFMTHSLAPRSDAKPSSPPAGHGDERALLLANHRAIGVVLHGFDWSSWSCSIGVYVDVAYCDAAGTLHELSVPIGWSNLQRIHAALEQQLEAPSGVCPLQLACGTCIGPALQWYLIPLVPGCSGIAAASGFVWMRLDAVELLLQTVGGAPCVGPPGMSSCFGVPRCQHLKVACTPVGEGPCDCPLP